MQENPEELKKVIDKIQKLLELQKGAERIGSLEESANAAGHIQRLLMKYSLTLSEIQEKTQQPEPGIKPFQFDLGARFDKREGMWLIELFAGIARLNNCLLLMINSGKGGVKEKNFVIVGKPHLVELVIFTAIQIETKIRILLKHTWKEYEGSEKMGTFRRGFFRGAQQAVIIKMNTIKEQVIEEEKSSNLPAIYHKEKVALEKFLEERFPNIRQRERRGTSSADGYSQGWHKGSQIEVNKGLSNSNAQTYIS